jgi:hypothetical protein
MHCRTTTAGEYFDVNDSDPTAMVENVYQAAHNETREERQLGPQPLQGEKEANPLLTIHSGHAQ